MSLLVPTLKEDFVCPGCHHRLSVHADNNCIEGCQCPRWWAEGLVYETFKAATKPLLISFYGPSGVGKSTCFAFARECLNRLKYTAIRLDVALPLRQIQRYGATLFSLKSPGRPELPDDFNQDRKLLEFLAEHYQNNLGTSFKQNLDKIIETSSQNTKLAIVNTDCRNNCYETLKTLGFVFVRIDAPDAILAQRKNLRGDLTPFNGNAAVESISEMRCRYQINNDSGLATLATRVFSVVDAIVATK